MSGQKILGFIHRAQIELDNLLQWQMIWIRVRDRDWVGGDLNVDTLCSLCSTYYLIRHVHIISSHKSISMNQNICNRRLFIST